MKKVLLLILILTNSLYASQLKIVEGHSSGECSDDNEILLKQARKSATSKAGNSWKQVGSWNQRVGNQGRYTACEYKRAIAESLFFIKTTDSEKNYLVIESSFANPRIDNTVPGVGEFSDLQVLEKIIEKAKKRALSFCKKVDFVITVSETKKIFAGSHNWYDYYAAEIKFECEYSETF